MGIARRGPHPDLAPDHEAQTFECAECGETLHREVGFDGKPFSSHLT